KSFPMKPERIVADIREAMPQSGVLSLDNGMYKIFIARNFLAHERNTVLLDNALATMGAGLPVGIATKLLYPKRKVLVVAGDGGFMMNAGELETAKRLGLDLVVLILNDSGFGMIRWKQEEMGLPDFGLKFGNPDFVALAKSFGVSGYRISKTADLLPTLKRALNSKGTHVIDCPIDYSGVNDALGKNLAEEIKGL
ncbi:MAG: thiamine pyrophosphate-dependent enzyme, partial [bacterium]|nr:thiamine pyrophosphate-dependent enzyme [bacterium]